MGRKKLVIAGVAGLAIWLLGRQSQKKFDKAVTASLDEAFGRLGPLHWPRTDIPT